MVIPHLLDMTPSFPRDGVSGKPGVVHRGGVQPIMGRFWTTRSDLISGIPLDAGSIAIAQW